jgi:hypothetical protein
MHFKLVEGAGKGGLVGEATSSPRVPPLRRIWWIAVKLWRFPAVSGRVPRAVVKQREASVAPRRPAATLTVEANTKPLRVSINPRLFVKPFMTEALLKLCYFTHDSMLGTFAGPASFVMDLS